MKDKEYGISLNLNLTKFNQEIQKAKKSIEELEQKNKDLKIKISESSTKQQAQKVKKQIEDEVRKVKVTVGEDSNEIEIKSNAKEVKENLEGIEDVQKRISSGDIKITGLPLSTEEMAQADREWEKMRERTARPLKTKVQVEEDKAKVQEVTYTLQDKFDAVSDIIKGKLSHVGSGLQTVVSEATSGFNKMFSLIKKIKAASSNIFGRITKNFAKNINSNINKGISNLKRFAFSLFGIQTAYRAVSKAVSSYLSYDTDLSKSIQSTWTGFGSFLAPILEYIVGLFQKLLAYANAVIKMFTGIDFVARANSKVMDKYAKSTNKANQALSSFDELQNLSNPSGSGNEGPNLIEIPDVDTSSIEDIFAKIKEKIEKGQFYELGALLAGKVGEALDSIPWESIKEKANKIGTNIAQFLNGTLSNPEVWKTIGRTIAEGFNTAIEFVYGFVTNFNFSKLGNRLGQLINEAISKIDWAKLGQTISSSIKGALDFAINLLETIDWVSIGNKIYTLLSNIDWGGIIRKTFELIGGLLGATAGILWGFLTQFVQDIGTTIKQKITDERTGEVTAESLLKGIADIFGNIGSWIDENITTPLIKGITKSLGLDMSEGEMEKKGKEAGDKFIFGLYGATGLGIKKFFDWLNETFTTKSHKTSSTAEHGGEGIGFGTSKGIETGVKPTSKTMDNLGTDISGKLSRISKDSETKSTGIGSVISRGIDGGVKSLQNQNWAWYILSPLNGLIAMFNKLADVINSTLSFKVSGPLKSLLQTLGVSVSGGRMQLLNISKMPFLKVGTDMVKQEGLAYLHAGEKVVPADVVKGGYSGGDNEETNNLLRQLLDVINEKDFNPYITVDDIGRASVNYINKKQRITGEAIV